MEKVLTGMELIFLAHLEVYIYLSLASWSSTNAAFNDIMRSFKFTTKDVIKIDYKVRFTLNEIFRKILIKIFLF
jgi:hypothetical protein